MLKFRNFHYFFSHLRSKHSHHYSFSSQKKPEDSPPPLSNEIIESSDKSNLIFHTDSSELIPDYTESLTKMNFPLEIENPNEFFPYKSPSGFSINTPSELQLKSNPLALEILTEGKIDLTNERISLENPGIQELSHYSIEKLKSMNEKIVQIN